MNVTISIQDCSLQELQVLLARLDELPAAPAATMERAEEPARPAPEPKPEPEPAPAAAAPVQAATKKPKFLPLGSSDARPVKVYHPSGAAKVYDSVSAASRGVGVSGSNILKCIYGNRPTRKGFRFEFVGEASKSKRPSVGEAIHALRELKAAEKPVVAYHKDGTIKYFHTVAEASRYCTCSVSFIKQNAGTGTVSGTGWRFEYDQEGSQITRKGGAR